MSSLRVDLRNKPRIVDFLAETVEFAPAKERGAAETLIEQYNESEEISTDKLAASARTIAFATWPIRFALHTFFSGKGAKQEMESVLASVRPSTAHLVKRVHKASGTKNLDDLLSHSDADIALQQEERHEIAQIRSQLRLEYWKAHTASMKALVKEAEEIFNELRHRIDALRNLAVEMPPALQDEVFGKISHYEDRIVYGGDAVPLKILDDEVQYYTEQKAISPLE